MARVWVLTSGRMGDDKQSLRLAAVLDRSFDLPFEEKKIVFNHKAKAWRVILGPSLASVDAARSDELTPPWPDVVFSTGWRQVPVVRWIKRQSGGRTRLVQMNRPPGPKHFDLILSPPQHSLPIRDNVVRLDWSLQLPPSAEALERARLEWKERLDRYPHPWTVMLLGGTSFPFDLDREPARRLFDAALARARQNQGSLLISTSRRTPEPALEVLRDAAAQAGDQAFLYEWRPDATENPYVAFLEGGDEFVITPDSISMLVEVARLGRPIAIAPSTPYRSFGKQLRNGLKKILHGRLDRRQSRAEEILSDLASLMGLKHARDLEGISKRLIAEGWAADFPEFGGREGRRLPDVDLEALAARIHGLIEGADAATR